MEQSTILKTAASRGALSNISGVLVDKLARGVRELRVGEAVLEHLQVPGGADPERLIWSRFPKKGRIHQLPDGRCARLIEVRDRGIQLHNHAIAQGLLPLLG